MNPIIQKRIEEAAEKIVCSVQCAYFDLDKTCCCYEKKFCMKTAEEVLQNQWISVEEVLPECDRCHLAMYEDGGIIVAKYENETWWWQDGFVVGRNSQGDLMYSSSCKVPDGLITHWLPIPPLKGDEK